MPRPSDEATPPTRSKSIRLRSIFKPLRSSGDNDTPPVPLLPALSPSPSTSVTDFATATACDVEAHARFCRALLERGVYPPPAQYEAWFVSLAHDEAVVDQMLEAAAEALDEALA